MSVEKPDSVPEGEVLSQTTFRIINEVAKGRGSLSSVIRLALNILVKMGASDKRNTKDRPLKISLLDGFNESIGQTYEGYKYHEM